VYIVGPQIDQFAPATHVDRRDLRCLRYRRRRFFTGNIVHGTAAKKCFARRKRAVRLWHRLAPNSKAISASTRRRVCRRRLVPIVLFAARHAAPMFGAKFVIRPDKITSFDGSPPKRFILLAFDSPERAQAWHNSAAQKEVDALRLKSSDSLSFMVEGMSN
jgi:uncharacterized protein (DUF1330 family)